MRVANQFKSIQQIQDEKKLTINQSKPKMEINSFHKVLEKRLNEASSELTFSKHALQQMQYRQIELDDISIQKLNEGVNSARKKGIKDSLMLMDNVAYVVSVKNATVITALEAKETKNHIFTNIDGAVVL